MRLHKIAVIFAVFIAFAGWPAHAGSLRQPYNPLTGHNTHKQFQIRAKPSYRVN